MGRVSKIEEFDLSKSRILPSRGAACHELTFIKTWKLETAAIFKLRSK